MPLLLAPPQPVLNPLDSTFATSKGIPFQRWFPYLEGFSIDFVNYIINYTKSCPKNILDPFGGNGTTAFAGVSRGIESYICEINPFLRDLFLLKIEIMQLERGHRLIIARLIREIYNDFVKSIDNLPLDTSLISTYEKSFGKSLFFDDMTFLSILKTKTFERSLKKSQPILARIFMIATASCLIDSSRLKRAGDLRYRNPSELAKHSPNFLQLLSKALANISEDISGFDDGSYLANARIFCHNAKDIAEHEGEFDMIITSPPYPNGTNYIRNTKIELWYSDHLGVNTDLRSLRDEAVTAGINDVTRDKFTSSDIDSVRVVIDELKKSEYDWRISGLIESHFSEMEKIFQSLYGKLKVNSIIAIDIGDSAYAGVHVKVDKIYEDLLQHTGFFMEENMHIRDRYSKGGMRLSQKLLIARRI